MSAPLILAVPSKGRLQQDAAVLFKRAGLALTSGGTRSYRGRIEALPTVEIAYLSAPEIAREIAGGSVHAGITGRDQVAESADRKADLTLALGFGRCDVVVAVPEPWVDVETMEDLDDVAASFRPTHGRRLTVATKYINITRRFFAGHGIADYHIVESLGATEGAPAAGAADLIVDITSTGATLRANGLKTLSDGLILASEAHLVASKKMRWTAEQKKTYAAVVAKLRAVV